MKKYSIIIISSLLISPILQGCLEDLLDEENIREPVADVYYKTASGYNDLIRSCYPFLRNFYGREISFAMNTGGTDIWSHGRGGAHQYSRYDQGLVPSHGWIWSYWQNFYLGIAACNTAIGRANEVEGLSEPERKRLLGEALFLRALYYHHLVMNFGPVPLRTEEVKQVETTATRTSEDIIYGQIIDDLKLAENYLPVTTSDYGRATKPAAQALLARVNLTLRNWEEAADYAKKVINDHNFSLVPDFEELWDIENQRNPEVIWSVQFSSDPRLNPPGNQAHMFFLTGYDLLDGMERDVKNGRPWQRFMPTRYFVDMLADTHDIDSRVEKSWTEVWYCNMPATTFPEMEPGDTAVYIKLGKLSEEFKERVKNKYNVFDVDNYFNPNSPNGEQPQGIRYRYPALNKHNDPLRISVNEQAGQRDVFVFRLAEMYLIAAEGLMMQNRLEEGVSYINVVRRRAAWPGNESQMEITTDQLTIDFILEERARELAGELLRWPDLKRTGKLIERVRMYNPDARDNIKEMHLVYPIPQNEIDRITNEDFVQNPGY